MKYTLHCPNGRSDIKTRQKENEKDVFQSRPICENEKDDRLKKLINPQNVSYVNRKKQTKYN